MKSNLSIFYFGGVFKKSLPQLSSVTQSCLTLCNPMGCSTLGLPIIINFQSLLKLMSIELVMPSNHLILCCPFSSCPQSFQHQSLFQWVLESGGQSTGVLASASVLPMNIQGWFPLGLIGLPRGETQNLSTITGSDSCWLWDVMSKLLNLTSLFFPFQHSNYRYLLCSAHNHCKDSARTIQMLF